MTGLLRPNALCVSRSQWKGAARRMGAFLPGLLLANLGLLGSAHGQNLGGNVSYTPHNLLLHAEGEVGAGMDVEPCEFCHGNHGIANSVLSQAQGYGFSYVSFEGLLDMTADPQPTGNSLLCLACHDGTLGSRSAGSRSGLLGSCGNCHVDRLAGGLEPRFTKDLRNQHPVSVYYDPTLDPSFSSVAEVEAAGLVLFDGKVQCMTCHDPHTNVAPPFLRTTDSGEGLCLICHLTPPAVGQAHFW